MSNESNGLNLSLLYVSVRVLDIYYVFNLSLPCNNNTPFHSKQVEFFL